MISKEKKQLRERRDEVVVKLIEQRMKSERSLKIQVLTWQLNQLNNKLVKIGVSKKMVIR